MGILRIRRSNLLLMCVFIRKKYALIYCIWLVTWGVTLYLGTACRSSDLPLVGNKSFLRVVVLVLWTPDGGCNVTPSLQPQCFINKEFQNGVHLLITAPLVSEDGRMEARVQICAAPLLCGTLSSTGLDSYSRWTRSDFIQAEVRNNFNVLSTPVLLFPDISAFPSALHTLQFIS